MEMAPVSKTDECNSLEGSTPSPSATPHRKEDKMAKVLDFMGEHPILTVILAAVVFGGTADIIKACTCLR